MLQHREECDDGNLNNEDGCSSACKVEPGFVCKDGKCQYNLKIIENRIISNGIITVFQTPIPLTQQQVNEDFKVKIDEGPEPQNIKIFQPNGDEEKIKVFMEYCILPPKKVLATYNLKKDPNVDKKIEVQYDLVNKEAKEL